MIHFFQTRGPHYGDILITNQNEKKNRDTIQASQVLEHFWRRGRRLATRGREPLTVRLFLGTQANVNLSDR